MPDHRPASPRGTLSGTLAKIADQHPLAIDFCIAITIAAIAALPRLIEIGNIPPGLHGDEAIAGIEAREIVEGGWKGPYTWRALGIPIGTFYWAAFWRLILGEGVTELRASFALMGIATVGVTYGAYRAMFDRYVAVIGALILAGFAWHVHFSRLAFIPLGWPLCQMASLLFFFVGLKRESRWWFALSGAALGTGFYTYQAFAIFAIAFVSIIVLVGAIAYWRRLSFYLSRAATLAGVALLVALPVYSYARDHRDIFEGRYRQYSITRTEDWKENGWLGRVNLIAEREHSYLRALTTEHHLDGVDGAGAVPLVDSTSLALILVGIGITLARLRRPEYLALAVAASIIALGPVLEQEGTYRRSLGLAVLLPAFAALPLAEAIRRARERSLPRAVAVACIAAGLAGTIVFVNLHRYFTTYDDRQVVGWPYAVEMREASEYLTALSRDTYVLFYYERATFNFEVRQYIAPWMQGEDRSEEFSPEGVVSFQADEGRPVVFLLMGRYRRSLDDIRQMYPGGSVFLGPPSPTAPDYIGYVLDQAATP